MEATDLSVLRRLLIDALALLAADASDQTAWVDRHHVMVDEIALNFDDAFRMAGRLIEHQQIGGSVLAALREIDALFASMSGPEHMDRWTSDALSRDQGWNQVRRLARQVLIELAGGEDHPLPNIQVIR
ncbi:hypothetical protein KIK06_05340 [Nocardiopsis sp. EMB25]|uniref:hypothetical protein n=1 Tax=Nocardiopsis sp. EMB25 TaxID=2835867 RepID=UPI0022852B53|nr:hypothetical protein [Nocardiopsis sp. EMB25]MCY9783317.1 hypothetical protein [Nocardiopsis sp. EMB25]